MTTAPAGSGTLSVAPGVRQLLVNTGQHYDDAMSDVFFRDLDLPRPDLGVDVHQTASGVLGGVGHCLAGRRHDRGQRLVDLRLTDAHELDVDAMPADRAQQWRSLLSSGLLRSLTEPAPSPDRYVYRVWCAAVDLDVTAGEQQLPDHVRSTLDATLGATDGGQPW